MIDTAPWLGSVRAILRRAIIRAAYQQAQRSVLASYTDLEGLADATAASLGCDKDEVLDVVYSRGEA